MYIVISLAILALIVFLVFVVGKRPEGKRLTPLAGLAFAFVVAGIVFGGERVVGYSLFAVAVVLAVVDILMNARRKP